MSLESIVASSRARLEAIGNYQVKMNRQERVGGTLLPAEDLVLSIRRNPKAVLLQWPDGPHRGREVIYSASENPTTMFVHMAESLVPMPRLSVPLDSPMAQRTSRHPISEAGFDAILAKVEDYLKTGPDAVAERGPVSYGGLEKPDSREVPCHKIVRVTPSGETWVVYIDPETKLPTHVQANGRDGELLERYVFRDLKIDPPDLAAAETFDPNHRWGQPKGLLQRMAEAKGAGSKPAATTRQ